jgi:hypothetical protein
MIEQGFLSPVRPKATDTRLSVARVHRRGGEFIAGELEAAVNKDFVTAQVVDEIMARGAERRSWLVFCAGVKHANSVAGEIRSRGVSCQAIVGAMPGPERDRGLRAFKAGELQAITNANVLTTRHREWVCLEHAGYPRQKAAQWWRRRAPAGQPVPLTTNEALARAAELARPKRIALKPQGKYTEIARMEF